MIKKCCISIILLFLFCASSHAQNNGWKTLDTTNYSIQYPANWLMNSKGIMGTSFVLYAMADTTDKDFKENINLLIQDLAGMNMDLDDFTKLSTDGIKKYITNSNLVESKKITGGANEYGRVIYTGDQGTMHLEFEQYYWIVNDKAYILTLTTGQNQFELLRKEGEAILNTFIIKK
jgi:hypothetical protein